MVLLSIVTNQFMEFDQNHYDGFARYDQQQAGGILAVVSRSDERPRTSRTGGHRRGNESFCSVARFFGTEGAKSAMKKSQKAPTRKLCQKKPPTRKLCQKKKP